MKTKVILLSLAAALWANLPAARGQTSLISTGTVWRYLADGSDQGTAWRSAGFDDGGWSNGVGLFGVDSPGIWPEPFRTPLPVGGGRITYYFRAYFACPNWWNWTNALLQATAHLDDGAVFYINGVEAGRVRLTNNPVLFDSLALNQGAEGTADTLTLSAASLVPGDNVLAVEVHQTTTNSSDLVFGMTLETTNTLAPLTLTCASNKLVVCETGTNLPAYSVVTTIANATANGRWPSGLIEGRDGRLYGTMSSGGSNNAGTVFAVNQDGTGYTVLRHFTTNGMDGNSPAAGLIRDASGVLYGTTSAGGSNNVGTVFKLNPDGTGFAILRSSSTSGADARNPETTLLLASDGALYGTANAGGAFNNGAVFKLNTDGSGYTILRSFNAADGEGNGSAGELIEGRDGRLYGTTESGPPNRRGTVFGINKDGTGFAVLRAFDTAEGNGVRIRGGVIEGPDAKLCGVTYEGGTNNAGVVFGINRDGSGFQVFHHFRTNGVDGMNPRGALTRGADGHVYGVTEYGGTEGRGTIYRVNPGGTGITHVHSFSSATGDRGLRPHGGLRLTSDGALHGATQFGGAGNNGLLYKLAAPCPWTFDPPGVTGGCCTNVTLTVLSTVTSGSNPLTVTRTWQATDCCSNTATCSQTVTVGNPPGLLGQPQSQTVLISNDVTFSISVAGTLPLSYQWRFLEEESTGEPISPIPGATNATHTVRNAQTNHSGTYDVVVANAFGSVTSAVARLSVVPYTVLAVSATYAGSSNGCCCWDFDLRAHFGANPDIFGVTITVPNGVSVCSASGPGTTDWTAGSPTVTWHIPGGLTAGGLGYGPPVTVRACFAGVPAGGFNQLFIGLDASGIPIQLPGDLSEQTAAIGANGECAMPPPANCCTNGAVNLVVNGSFESPALAPDSHNEDLDGQSGVPGWTSGVIGEDIEIWNGSFGNMQPSHLQQHLEISADTALQTVRQVVNNFTPGCPATLCFDFAGRPGGFDNRFVVQVTDGSGLLLIQGLNPMAYPTATPGGWDHFSATVVPVVPPLTISFSGTPGDGQTGGAHIDNVQLCQCCPGIACPTNIVVDCEDDLGAVVNYIVPAVTNECCPGPVTATCVPPPGLFPIGVTPVFCTAVDVCGNSNTCCFSVTVRGHGSQADWDWARKAGGALDDQGQAVAVDDKGNVFVTGFYNGSMVFPGAGVTLASFGGNDIFLAKYNSAGVLQWAARAGGAGQDAGYGVAVDADGNAYLTGEFTGAATFESRNNLSALPLNSSGGRDIFVAKYDADGFCQWTYADGTGQRDDRGAGIAVKPDGSEVFVTGDWGFQSTVQVFVLKLTGGGAFSARVVSMAGAVDLAQFARGRGIALDSGGNAYVAGLYGGTVATTEFPPSAQSVPVSSGGARVFAAKFDPALNCLWTQHSGHSTANGDHDGMGIAVGFDPTLNQEFCYVTAYFRGTADFGGSSVPMMNVKNSVSDGQLSDYLITKLDAGSGAAAWAIQGGGPLTSHDETRGIAVDSDGNPCVTGFINPNASSIFVNEGPIVLVASYSPAGVLRWTANTSAAVPATAEDVGLGIAVDRAGCVHVTGAFTGGLNLPGLTVSLVSSPFAEGDMFAGKICPNCCGTGNLVQNGSFELPQSAFDNANFESSVPGWNTSESAGFIELWSGAFGAMSAQEGYQHLEINANESDSTVSQVVTNLNTNCPTTLCFSYSGRYSTPLNNRFTVQISGAGFGPFSATYTPASFANAGWQRACTGPFLPPSALTISFRGWPPGNTPGGGHIDNVSLTQNCCSGRHRDSDGDGMADVWERASGLNPNDPADAQIDADNDGMSNLSEFIAGTKPNDALSHLRVKIPWPKPEGPDAPLTLQFEAMPNVGYVVEETSQLRTAWSPLTMPGLAAQPFGRLIEVPLPASTNGVRFFRVRVQQP